MLRQFAYVFWGRAGIVACRTITTMVLAHHLVPGDLGRLTFLITVFDVFTSVTSVGIMVAGPVMVAEAGERGRYLVWPMLVQAILCALGSALLLMAARHWFGDTLFDGYASYSVDLLILSLVPGQLIWAQLGYLTGREYFLRVSILSMLHWGGYLLAVLALVLASAVTLSTAVTAFLAPSWLAATVGLVLVLADGRSGFSHSHLRALLDLGWRSQLTQVLNLLQMRLDMLLLRLLSSADQLGYYSVATSLSEWILYLPRSLRQIAVPRSARGAEMPSKVYGWLFGVMVLVALVVGVLAPWIVRILFGEAYIAAVPVAQVILPGTVLLGLGTLASGVLFGRRDTSFLMLSGAVMVLAFLVADLFVIPRWGALGCAAVSSVLYSIYSVWLLRRLFAAHRGGLRDCFVPVVPWSRVHD